MTETLSNSTNVAHEAVKIIQQRAPGFTPKLFVVCGSGLGKLAELVSDPITISYDELPGFPDCSVKGHQGTVVLGTVNDLPIAVLTGRIHFYEGHSNDNMCVIIRTMKLLGCETMLATNSSGSLRTETPPGSLVLLTDHINFQFRNPLVGPNDNSIGPRFVGMEDAYDVELRQLMHRTADQLGTELTDGVYIGVLGPTFETPAEIRAYKLLGADLVGMSTVVDVIVARHAGLKVAVVSAITNMAAGMHSEQLSHDITLQGAKLASEKMLKLVHEFLINYAKQSA